MNESPEKPAAESENAEGKGGVVNDVKRTVDEIVKIMGDQHEHREELSAHGIPYNTINVLVEFGMKDQLEERTQLRETARLAAVKQYGPAALSAEEIDRHLDELQLLEHDLRHVRKVGNNQKLDMGAINMLTMLIRQNPGDGAERVLNCLFGYALACDIPVYRAVEIAEKANSAPKSVLPVIEREDIDERKAAQRRMAWDVGIGLVFGISALLLMT